MEKDKLDNFINNWNGDFPDYQLKPADLKEPLAVMGALMQVFDRLGIDRAILTETPEDKVNDSVAYYRDLLPVIKMIRAVNHVVSVMPQVTTINMTHFLLPTIVTSHSILLLLFNLMLFNEGKLKDIAPYEDQLFAQCEQVNKLAEKKHKLQEMLNEQAQEKALRSERLEKLEQSTKQLEEDLKEETAACNAEQQVLDEALKEHKHTEVLLDQKRTHRDAILGEVEKKKALRVYDADDVKTQVEQATRAVQELEELGASLQATLVQKQDSLQNLQTLKPSLDTANSLLQEIMKQTENLQDMECGDLESESQEGELDTLQMELGELRAHHAELCAALAELRGRAREAEEREQQEVTNKQSALREASERDAECRERCARAARRVDRIKQLTGEYEARRARGLREIQDIHDGLRERIQSCEQMLMNQMLDLVKRVEEKHNKV